MMPRTTLANSSVDRCHLLKTVKAKTYTSSRDLVTLDANSYPSTLFSNVPILPYQVVHTITWPHLNRRAPPPMTRVICAPTEHAFATLAKISVRFFSTTSSPSTSKPTRSASAVSCTRAAEKLVVLSGYCARGVQCHVWIRILVLSNSVLQLLYYIYDSYR